MSETADLAAQHTPGAVSARLAEGPRGGWLRDFVYGAVDGTVTTFAVVAGVAGAGLRPAIAVVLGLANLLADGFSMATANFLGGRAEAQRRSRIRREERRHVELVPEGEREELRQLFAAHGLAPPALDEAVDAIARQPDRWVDLMVEWEHGFATDRRHPLHGALVTFAAFTTVGAIPLLGLGVGELLTGGSLFLWSSAFTALAFALVGVLKGVAVDMPRWRSATETVLLGGAAAALAYAVGLLLGGFT